jgi:hypothetical protein
VRHHVNCAIVSPKQFPDELFDERRFQRLLIPRELCGGLANPGVFASGFYFFFHETRSGLSKHPVRFVKVVRAIFHNLLP